MRFQVAKDFKGELSLPSVGHPMTANAVASVKEDEIYNHDIQMAIKKGWISFIDKLVQTGILMPEFKVTNIGKSRLVIGDIDFEKGDMKFLKQSQIDLPNIQRAIDMSLLAVEAPEVESQPPALNPPKKKMRSQPVENDNQLQRPEEPTTTVRSWDAHAEEVVPSTMVKEAQKEHVKQIKGSDDLDVKTGEVDFTKEDEPDKKTRRKRKKKKTSKKSKSKTKTLKPVGRKRPKPTADGVDNAFVDADNLPNEVDFVDHEQLVERVSAHPKLKAKMNDIVDLELE